MKKIITAVTVVAIICGSGYGVYKVHKGWNGTLPTEEEKVTIELNEDENENDYNTYMSYLAYDERIKNNCQYNEDTYNEYITDKYGDKDSYIRAVLKTIMQESGKYSDENIPDRIDSILEKVQADG